MATSAQAEPDPYYEMTDPAYAAAAAVSFTVEISPETVLLRGTCPRCLHPMSYPHVKAIYRTSDSARPGGPATNSVQIPMLCTCVGYEHSGAPPSFVGCGAYWNLKLERQP